MNSLLILIWSAVMPVAFTSDQQPGQTELAIHQFGPDHQVALLEFEQNGTWYTGVYLRSGDSKWEYFHPTQIPMHKIGKKDGQVKNKFLYTITDVTLGERIDPRGRSKGIAYLKIATNTADGAGYEVVFKKDLSIDVMPIW